MTNVIDHQISDRSQLEKFTEQREEITNLDETLDDNLRVTRTARKSKLNRSAGGRLSERGRSNRRERRRSFNEIGRSHASGRSGSEDVLDNCGRVGGVDGSRGEFRREFKCSTVEFSWAGSFQSVDVFVGTARRGECLRADRQRVTRNTNLNRESRIFVNERIWAYSLVRNTFRSTGERGGDRSDSRSSRSRRRDFRNRDRQSWWS